MIFQRSIDQAKLPSIWKEANVSPIFKKGDKTDSANYRPISLTCVLCKVLEHIVASNISKHFTKQNILYDLQHGFREKGSCETHLIILIDELSKNMQSRKQTDLILLAFNKAFGKLHMKKYSKKLHLFGIRGDTLKWIKHFVDNKKQSVVTNGFHSGTVSSGVPQDSVLRSILFLAYISDLPEHLRSRVRLFADDTAIYLCISFISEANILQEDLCKLEKWEEAWDMNFHPSKCQVLHVTRLNKILPLQYRIRKCICCQIPRGHQIGLPKLGNSHRQYHQKS